MSPVLHCRLLASLQVIAATEEEVLLIAITCTLPRLPATAIRTRPPASGTVLADALVGMPWAVILLFTAFRLVMRFPQQIKRLFNGALVAKWLQRTACFWRGIADLHRPRSLHSYALNLV